MTEGGIIIIILAAELRERPGGGALSYFPFSFIFFFFYKQLLKIPGNYSNCCAEKKNHVRLDINCEPLWCCPPPCTFLFL